MRFFVLVALGSLALGCGGGTGGTAGDAGNGALARSPMIQTRAQETDGLPMPLLLTLNALWGTFENTENIPMGGNVVGQDATYLCELPGPVEICVDATDGACIKTLCTTVTCPEE